VYEDGSQEPIRIFDRGIVYEEPESFGEYQLSYRTGDVVSPRIEATEPIAVELDDFATAVQTGRTPAGSAEFGVKVVRITEAADAALEVSDVTAGAF
jgi:predicted dehydrogenase